MWTIVGRPGARAPGRVLHERLAREHFCHVRRVSDRDLTSERRRLSWCERGEQPHSNQPEWARRHFDRTRTRSHFQDSGAFATDSSSAACCTREPRRPRRRGGVFCAGAGGRGPHAVAYDENVPVRLALVVRHRRPRLAHLPRRHAAGAADLREIRGVPTDTLAQASPWAHLIADRAAARAHDGRELGHGRGRSRVAVCGHAGAHDTPACENRFGRISARFPPAVANRLLLSSLTAAIT